MPALRDPATVAHVLAEELIARGVQGPIALLLRAEGRYVTAGGSGLTRTQERLTIDDDHPLVVLLRERRGALFMLEGGHGGTELVRGVPATHADPVGILPMWEAGELVAILVLGGLGGRPVELIAIAEDATPLVAATASLQLRS